MKSIIFIFTIIILLFYNACVNIQQPNVTAKLNIVKKKRSTFLVLNIINNSNGSIYIPNLSMSLFNDLHIYNSNNKEITDSFYESELRNYITYYGPPKPNMERPESFCDSVKITMNDIDDLDNAPFTKRKKLIHEIVNYEYQQLITKSKITYITEPDILDVKQLIFTKYNHSVFIYPHETFSTCTTINTLANGKNTYKFYYKHIPNKTIDTIVYKLNNNYDSIMINTLLLKRFKEYKLYNNIIKTDTLVFSMLH